MRFVGALAVVLALLVQIGNAQAHASLIRSEPANDVVVARSPSKLILTFNEPVSPLALRLVAPDGTVNELKDVDARGETVAASPPARLGAGTYLLSWRVISADGHPVGGALTFSIGRRTAAPTLVQQDTGPRWRAATWFARLVLYGGLFVGVGGAFYGRWIASSPSPAPVRTVLRVALLCGLVAAVLSAGLQGVDMVGTSLSDLSRPAVWGEGLASPYGLTLVVAVAALGLGLAAVSLSPPTARWCAALALIGVGCALAASGHAATASPELATRPAVFLHGVSVAFWVGALLPLATALRHGGRRTELLRFSKMIPWPLIVLVISGALLAVVQLQRVDALWTTAYGLTLFCKLVAVAMLLAFAVFNRWLTPRAAVGDARSMRHMTRSIGAELVIVVVILGLVATWRFTPPPRSLFAATQQPVHVHIHAEKAMADMEFEPANPRGRRVTIDILDGEFRPLAAKEVELVLSQPAAGIEPLRLPAKPVEGTRWQVDGLRIALSGRWNVRVDILVSDFEKITIEDEYDFR